MHARIHANMKIQHTCISVSALTRTFACEALNVCTHTYMRSLRQRLALTSVEGIRKGLRWGEMWLQFHSVSRCVRVSENQSVS